ncbi:MAG: cation:proton antiporter [Eubacterium sp.]|jgi:Kef-type K+ transport system membrane component KefB|nr:cation:proton antiporter [Eubacterium sp.]
MEEYGYLLFIALVLISTKFLGLVTKKFHMPQVVGALVAGLIIGPACLNLSSVLLAGAESQSMIESLSEVGVIVLMFSAGLETDIQKLKKSGLASLVIALMGVIVPCLGGYLVAYFFTDGGGAADLVMYRNIFIGVILTATSVSITVETLREMGKLNTNAGNAILGAAVIDDVLGIIALTIITTLGTGGEGGQGGPSIWMVLLKIVLFFIFAFVVAFGVGKLYYKWTNVEHEPYRRYGIIAFAFCLLFAFCSEYFFNVADITGAYVAGLAISVSPKIQYISKRFETVSYMFLSPIFFASIGLEVVLPEMSGKIVIFAVLLCLVAVVSKVIGCGLGAKAMKYSNQECLQIGVGMVSRGEVALIVASKGMAVGLMTQELYGPIIITVVITTIVTPILLKVAFRK